MISATGPGSRIFQSAVPSILETSSRLLAVADGDGLLCERLAQGLRHGLGIAKIAHGDVLCMSEPDVSGGCVADPVARAKGGQKARYVHRPRKGAQPAGRIHREVILSRPRMPVYCEAAWRIARSRLIRGCDCGRSSMVERQL